MKHKMIKRILSLSAAALMLTGAAAAVTPLSVSARFTHELLASVSRFSTSDNADGTITLTKYNGSETDVRIPAYIDGKRLTAIGASAFEGRSGIESINIPVSVTRIGDHAFKGCTSLKTVFLPRNVRSVNGSAFIGCTSLIAIYADSQSTNFTSTNGVLFDKSRTTLVAYPAGRADIYTIPSGVTAIGNHAFSENGQITSVTMPDSVVSVGFNSFDYCTNLKKITLSRNLTEIKMGGFNGCRSLTTVTLPESLTFMDNYAFAGCSSLKSVVIPSKMTELRFSLFEGCTSLRYVRLPKGLRTIYPNAFDRCRSLISLNLPSTVTKVYSLAFIGCTKLTNLTVTNSKAVIDPLAFEGNTALTIYGKSGSTAEALANKLGIPFSAGTAPALSLSTVTKSGRTISVTAKAVDGKSPYSFEISYRSANDSKFTTVQAFSSNRTVSFKVAEKGTYIVRVSVKDGSSNTTYEDYSIKI